MRRSVLTLLAALVATGAVAAAAPARSNDTTLGLVGYAVPREALGALIKEWQKTPEGQGVDFTQSYGASADQARAVAAGLRTDIVNLSWAGDVDLLVKAGLVNANWDKQSYNGVVTHSLVVFAVRPGNPKKIKSWDDLIRPGIEVITANPFTSGAAKWNILAAYGAQRKLGKTDAQARSYVQKLFNNVAVTARSGRDATNAFLSGKGDVLLAYENEALLSRRNGTDIQFYIPKQTMVIEASVAVVKNGNEAKANQFIRYIKSAAGQRIWADWGFRPVNTTVAKEFKSKFPSRPTLFTLKDPIFGGWRKADIRWFHPQTGLMVNILKNAGIGAG
jgi:sulfate/thiosulfate-binding protein